MNYYSYELERLGYEELDPMEFYRDVFPEGELATQKDDPKDYETGKYSAIAIEIENEDKSNGKKRKVKRYTITDELDNLDLLMYSDDFCFMSPISYAGKNRNSTNARFMYALCIEVDNLQIKFLRSYYTKTGKHNEVYDSKKKRYSEYEYTGLNNLIKMFKDYIPLPTYIVSSGTGIHLYYVFEQAIPLFPNIAKKIEKYKRALTKKIWCKKVTKSYKEEDIQYESIFQGFRIPGTLTKAGAKTHNRRDDVATVHRVGKKVTADYLNEFVSKANKMNVVYKSKLTRSEAKKLYPSWYNRRVVNKEKPGHWICNENLYNWWYNRIYDEAKVGHRYYCLMMLCIYAIKCDISEDRLQDDCMQLMSKFEELTEDEDNHFTEKDVLDAMQTFYNKDFITYPINSIQNRSGLHIEKNKRNYRKQKDHIDYMNNIREYKISRDECTAGGRNTKEEIVREWQEKNPDGTKYRCIKETGLAKHTVYKWWNDNIDQEITESIDDDNIIRFL